jgi:polyhydroxyalkanoate synthesis regulator phasin
MILSGGTMSDQTTEQPTPEQAGPAETQPDMNPLRKALLVGVGALALTQDELAKFVKKSAERGATIQTEGKKQATAAMSHRKEHFDKVEEQLTKRMESILVRVNFPTKSDVQKLSDQVEELTKKIEELNNKPKK